jgi:hypothetical protein
MKKSKVILPVLVLLAAMLIFACGGGDDNNNNSDNNNNNNDNDSKFKTYTVSLSKEGIKSFKITLEGGKFKDNSVSFVNPILDTSLLEYFDGTRFYTFALKFSPHQVKYTKISDTIIIGECSDISVGSNKENIISLRGTLKFCYPEYIYSVEGARIGDNLVGKPGADSITFD